MLMNVEPPSEVNVFQNVDKSGNLFIVDRLGSINRASGKPILPIFYQFDSNLKSDSPYLGLGWEIPLLESKFVQLSEREYMLKQPDGWYRRFWKDRRRNNVLHGQGGWKAIIEGDTVTAVAECGDDAIKYKNGRIIHLHTNDSKFDFIYENNKVTKILEGKDVVLEVMDEKTKSHILLPKNNHVFVLRHA